MKLGRKNAQYRKVIKALQTRFCIDYLRSRGGTRKTTLHYARILKQEFGFEVMPHLTCVGHTVKELLEILDEFSNEGFCNIMALRGDPPKGETFLNQLKVVSLMHPN